MRNFFEKNGQRIKRNTSRRDIIFLVLCVGIVLAIVLLITRGRFMYGNQFDWLNQHSVLPDYFRQTFYQTGNLFPDFNINLGAGQNAYNIAYYGYLSPVILISYFLPFVSMENYIMISSIVIVIVSAILMFYWLKMQPGLSTKEVYFGTILFICSGPIIYHSHMQIMFMNYMPFLIMALIGIDLMYKDNNRRFLTINIALMFLTSYFFAFSAMFALSIYAIYKYLDKPVMFWKRVKDYAMSCVVGIMISCVVTLPAFAAIMTGRSGGANSKHQSILSMLIPEMTSKDIGYTAYCIGLPAIFVVAMLVFALFEKKIANKFLGISVLAFSIFPILRYILNGFLYTRQKVLIPFVPLAVLIVVIFANNLSKNVYSIKQCIIAGIIVSVGVIIDWKLGVGSIAGLRIVADIIMLIVCIAIDKYMRNKKRNDKIKFVYVYSAFFTIIACLVVNVTSTLVKLEDAEKYFNNDKLEVITEVLDSDDELYRFTDLCNSKYTNNHFWGQKYLAVGCYSSVSNQNYNSFCNYDLGINNPTVNDITVVPPSDVMFNTLMGVKYIVDDKDTPVGYDKTAQKGKYVVSKNENAYALGFATNNVMSVEEFNKLSPEDREMVLLQSIVIEDKQFEEKFNVLDYESKFEKVDIDTSMGLKKDKDGYYSIKTGNESKKYNIDIPDSLAEYVYVVKCSLKGYTENSATIRVNGIQNSLSGTENAFPNKNFDFKFVVSSNVEKRNLEITFTKNCDFKFSELELYRIKYEDIAACRKNMTMMNNIKIEHEKEISGDIELEEDAVFTTTIPYDPGFTVYVDGNKTEYFRTDKAFLGFNLDKGKHTVEMIYKAPLANEGKIVSIIGILILLFFGSKGIKFSSKNTVAK